MRIDSPRRFLIKREEEVGNVDGADVEGEKGRRKQTEQISRLGFWGIGTITGRANMTDSPFFVGVGAAIVDQMVPDPRCLQLLLEDIDLVEEEDLYGRHHG